MLKWVLGHGNYPSNISTKRAASGDTPVALYLSNPAGRSQQHIVFSGPHNVERYSATEQNEKSAAN